MAGLDQTQEDEVFAPESGQRRYPGQREHEDQHEYSFHRGARVEAVQVIQFVADHVLVPQRSDHAEGAQVHERIDQQVDQDAFEPVEERGAGILRGSEHDHA